MVSMRTAPARVLLDASNLTIGGGVQVAASLVDEFRQLQTMPDVVNAYPWLAEMSFRVSPEVEQNLTTKDGTETTKVVRRHWADPNIWTRRYEREFDLQLTVFGPRYGRRLAPITLTGIADVTSVYPWPSGIPAGPLVARMKRGIRGLVSRYIFARESFLVSESASLLKAFHERTGFDSQRAAIIPNVVNNAVADPRERKPLEIDIRSRVDVGTVLLCYVARYYPHKNHDMLPRVRAELLKRGVAARFVVTFTDQEWAKASDELRASCVNAGVIPINQIAALNMECEAAFFPSLLESFSASPLEALLSNGLLFASDRPFVRDVCGDAAAYFDPLDPSECARVICGVLKDGSLSNELRRRARAASARLGTSRERALTYASLVDRLLAEGRCS